jgi:integrase
MAMIRKRGSRYNVQIRNEGYPSITKIFTSISVARKWTKSVEADMERRIHVEIPDQTTVGELLKRYQKQILLSHKGQQVEAYRLGTLKKHLGALRLIHLTPKEVASYRDLRLQEVSPSSLKRELTILSCVLTVASRDWGISISQNPVKMISLPKADKPRTRRLEAGEKERLLQGANPDLNRIISLALETGMRRGEILSIKKSHIDFNKSVLFIPSTKTDQPRTTLFQVRL